MSTSQAAVLMGAAILAGSVATPVQAQSALPAEGDIFIISRDANRLFRGSHKIYARQSDGLVEVSYCGRPYWVRYATVAWTQLETEMDYNVRVEFNWGKGWRPICDRPQEQVNLKGLGISEDPRIVMQNDGVTDDRVNRFAAIRKSFRPTGNTSSKTSFHEAE